jgi:drug/metabolite transporter, DME family
LSDHAGHSFRIFAAAALFSTAGAAIKATALTSWQVAGLRAAFAGVTLLVLLPETRRHLTRSAALVGLAYAATVILFVQANKLTTTANAIYIQSTSPLYILLLGPWLLKEKIRRSDVVFLAAIAAGVALFFVGLDAPAETAPDPLRGNLCAVASGFACGVMMVGLRGLARKDRLASASAVLIGNAMAVLVCLPLALPLGSVRAMDLGLVAYLGIFQIGVAYVFLTRAMTHVPALETALLLFVEPVLAPVWAWLVHGEAPGAWSLVGGGVILGATSVRTILDLRGRSHAALGSGRSETNTAVGAAPRFLAPK